VDCLQHDTTNSVPVPLTDSAQRSRGNRKPSDEACRPPAVAVLYPVPPAAYRYPLNPAVADAKSAIGRLQSVYAVIDGW